MNTICYMRVSSPKRNGYSRQKTDSQKIALKQYCRNNQIKRLTYIQDFSTGRKQDRQGFQQILEDCEQGKCQQLIVWKLDRLGRSAVETIKTIQLLMSQKIKIVVTTQGLTFDQSPYSTFLIQLFAALAPV